MKTIEQIMKYDFKCADRRDFIRICEFLSAEQLEIFGIQLKDEYKVAHKPVPLTRENILERLERDVALGFEKALTRRGISAGFMFDVVMMWNWILEEGFEEFSEDDYSCYGLPLFRMTALKYGFNNPIGKDTGAEKKFRE